MKTIAFIVYCSLYSLMPCALAHWLSYNWGFLRNCIIPTAFPTSQFPHYHNSQHHFITLFSISDYFKICTWLVLELLLSALGILSTVR